MEWVEKQSLKHQKLKVQSFGSKQAIKDVKNKSKIKLDKSKSELLGLLEQMNAQADDHDYSEEFKNLYKSLDSEKLDISQLSKLTSKDYALGLIEGYKLMGEMIE